MILKHQTKYCQISAKKKYKYQSVGSKMIQIHVRKKQKHNLNCEDMKHRQSTFTINEKKYTLKLKIMKQNVIRKKTKALAT